MLNLAQGWYRVDPLAGKFAGHSPYNYVLGNPVRLVDPDGKAPQDIIIKRSTKDDGTIVLNVTVTGKIVNLSSTTLYSSQLDDYAERINNTSSFDGRTAFAGSGSDRQNVELNVDFQFTVAKSVDDIGDSDHVIAIVDGIPKQSTSGENPAGIARLGGHVAAVEVAYMKGSSTTTTHELGHNLGLDHRKVSGALMHPMVNNGKGVTFAERQQIAGGLITGKDGSTTVGSVNQTDVTRLKSRKDIIQFLKDTKANYNDNR